MIAKFNRIVVDHGDWEGLIALALVNNETGEEANRSTLESWAKEQGFLVTPLVNKQLEACAEEDLPNFEGYVATWHKAGSPPLRTKIKLETYTKLHRILTGLNPKTVWELLSTGQGAAVDGLLADPKMPEGFTEWLRAVATELMVRYARIEREAQAVFAARPQSPVRKDQAMYFKQTPHLCSVLFAMLDNKTYAEIIWDRIKPKGTDTFKRDGE